MIPMKEIQLIEMLNKTCIIHTESELYSVIMPLNALFELLDKDIFIRAQQNYAVNMNYIDSFFFDHIILQNGTKIALSRNNLSILGDIAEKYGSGVEFKNDDKMFYSSVMLRL